MSRTEQHPHVRTIMAAIDRAIASPDKSVAANVASKIVTYGYSAEDFECFIRPKCRRWTRDGLRSVVLAYALNAPSGDLAALATAARKEHAWVEWWDLAGHDLAGIGHGELLLPEPIARRVEKLQRAS